MLLNSPMCVRTNVDFTDVYFDFVAEIVVDDAK